MLISPQKAAWADSSKIFYNKLGYEESLEPGFDKIGGYQVDSGTCKSMKIFSPSPPNP